MNSDFTICIATYGDRFWQWRAERAVLSAQGQAAVIHIHDAINDLQRVRNDCLAAVNTEFVIFLDGDDELEPGYVAAMAQGTTDIRAPRRRLMRNGWEERRGLHVPRVAGHYHECSGDCLPMGNWIVVGAAARTELLRAVGGWDDYAIYEDWALWLKCYRAGASFETLPDAIYRQHLRYDSRNRSGPAYDEREVWHRRIVSDILGAEQHA